MGPFPQALSPTLTPISLAGECTPKATERPPPPTVCPASLHHPCGLWAPPDFFTPRAYSFQGRDWRRDRGHHLWAAAGCGSASRNACLPFQVLFLLPPPLVPPWVPLPWWKLLNAVQQPSHPLVPKCPRTTRSPPPVVSGEISAAARLGP